MNATGSSPKFLMMGAFRGHANTDVNKTDLTNFDMTTMTIEYRRRMGGTTSLKSLPEGSTSTKAGNLMDMRFMRLL